MSADAKVLELGLKLPPPPPPGGLYRGFLRSDSLVFLSGHGPLKTDGSYITGKVGVDHDLDGGYEAARQTGLALLSTLRENLDSLDRIAQIVKLTGFVNCLPDFNQQPQVINGCSELFRDVFGPENGIGTRSAVGAVSLPLDFTVEIEAIIAIR